MHSAGSCQGWGRGFESPRPLQFFPNLAANAARYQPGGKHRVSVVIDFTHQCDNRPAEVRASIPLGPTKAS